MYPMVIGHLYCNADLIYLFYLFISVVCHRICVCISLLADE